MSYKATIARWDEIEKELEYYEKLLKKNRKPLWKFWVWMHKNMIIHNYIIFPLMNEKYGMIEAKIHADNYLEMINRKAKS